MSLPLPSIGSTVRRTGRPSRRSFRQLSRLGRFGANFVCSAALLGMAGCTTAFWQQILHPQPQPPAVDTAKSNEPYHTKLKRVNLVIERQELSAKKRGGAAMPVALRIYPLKQLESFATASVSELREHDKAVLGRDRLGRIDLTLTPGEAVQIPVPMPDGTKYVGVVVFFRDRQNAEWQLAVPRTRWDNEDPVTLVINGNRLELATDAD